MYVRVCLHTLYRKDTTKYRRCSGPCYCPLARLPSHGLPGQNFYVSNWLSSRVQSNSRPLAIFRPLLANGQSNLTLISHIFSTFLMEQLNYGVYFKIMANKFQILFLYSVQRPVARWVDVSHGKGGGLAWIRTGDGGMHSRMCVCV